MPRAFPRSHEITKEEIVFELEFCVPKILNAKWVQRNFDSVTIEKRWIFLALCENATVKLRQFYNKEFSWRCYVELLSSGMGCVAAGDVMLSYWAVEWDVLQQEILTNFGWKIWRNHFTSQTLDSKIVWHWKCEEESAVFVIWWTWNDVTWLLDRVV
jgi:hypothetical protein